MIFSPTKSSIAQFHLNCKPVFRKFIPEFIESKRGPKGYSRHALTRAFVVMNCEHFREITLLCDFLNTNLKIAQLCGFDITKPLPSYSVYQRFIHDIDNNLLKEIMKSQVNELIKLDLSLIHI